MSDISHGPKSTSPREERTLSDRNSLAASTDLSSASLNTGLSTFEPVERSPHTRESVAHRWRSNREFSDTGTRMIINAGGKAS